VKKAAPEAAIKKAPTAKFTGTGNKVALDGIELTEDTSKVAEYPFYETRLKDIDWQAAIDAETPFEDPHFAADITSIYEESLDRRPGIDGWADFVWKRPSEVYGEGNFTLYENIDPSDIKQGKCGDCYFLSCLSSLAEFPKRIQDIFVNDFTNKAGCYAVTFYICGEKKTVVIDDRFPYDEEKKRWGFSRSSQGNEIWV